MRSALDVQVLELCSQQRMGHGRGDVDLSLLVFGRRDAVGVIGRGSRNGVLREGVIVGRANRQNWLLIQDQSASSRRGSKGRLGGKGSRLSEELRGSWDLKGRVQAV